MASTTTSKINEKLKRIRHFLIHNVASKITPHIPWFFYNIFRPEYIIIELTNICNLKCPVCPTSQNMLRRKGFMSYENFVRIIDQVKSFKPRIMMNFAGEPLMNKDVFKMTAYAYEQGLSTMISTNATFLDKFGDEIFSSGLGSLTVCLDGATKASHEFYRVGSDFEQVKSNIKKICERKKELKAKSPIINLQTLITSKSEHELPEVITMAHELGVDLLSFKTISMSSWLDIEKKLALAKKYVPTNAEFSRYKLSDGDVKLITSRNLCGWVRGSVIYLNGDVTTCCVDFNGANIIGNILEDKPFKKLWYSKKYCEYRKRTLNRKFTLCKTCSFNTDNFGRKVVINPEIKVTWS